MVFAQFAHRLAAAKLVPHTPDEMSPELGERETIAGDLRQRESDLQLKQYSLKHTSCTSLR